MTDERFDQIEDVFDRLAQDARVQPIREDAMDIRNAEQLKAARDAVRGAMSDGLFSAAQLARRTGIKPTAISVFLNDKWVGSAGTQYTVAATLLRAVNVLVRQRHAEETAVGGFVRVPFAERTFAVAQLTVKRKIISVITAPAGSGKSVCCEALRDEIPGSVLLTVGKTRANVKPFLGYFAAMIGVDPNGRADMIQERITSKLVGSDRLVLVDEAHKLLLPTLDVLREIHDEAGIPILMAATPVFRKTITSQRGGVANRELLDQLYSRIALFCDLSELAQDGGADGGMHSIEAIRRIFARGKVRLSRDGAAFLSRLANTPAAGGLRRCRHLVQAVIDLYPGDEVTAERLRAVLGMSVGTREAGFVVALAGAAERGEPAAAATA